MVRIFKTSESDFQEAGTSENFRLQTAVPRLSSLVGSKHMMFDLRRLNPGHYSFPYHFHRNAEELFLIISGNATLRTPDGFRKVSEGDLVFFGIGDTGAHQLYNHGDGPCIYLDIRTVREIDIAEYPDSGKINIFPKHEIFEKSAQVGYFQGEENIEKKWPHNK